MDLLYSLADPVYVAKFQRLCGIETEKPETCDQHTQTRKAPYESSSEESSVEHEECNSRYKHEQVFVDNTDTYGISDKGLFSNNQTLPLEKDDWPRQRILYNNNEMKENDKNLILSKKLKLKSKNGYALIEPTRRVCGKGSIFESSNPDILPSDFCEASLKTKSIPVVHIKYKSLFYLAKFGAFLGNEGFYLTFFPFCLWNLDGLVTRQTAYLWCIVMYLGQATKDYLCWPRPPCPPVVRLETDYLQEYSMPSTHAMAATAIPLYLAYITVQRYQVPVYIAAFIAFLWFSITCLSRIYLGVHTFLDLLAGCLYAILIFFSFTKYVEDFDVYHQTHLFASLIVLFTGLALCTVCYPSNFKSSSKGDAVQIVASLTGVAIGMWLCFQLGYSQQTGAEGPYSITSPTLTWVGMASLRFITGVCIIFGVHSVTRIVTIQLFSSFFGLEKPDKTHPSVMTGYKFTTYCMVGICISFFVPVIHMYFGIHRPAVFLEMS
ncbi:sphingosine-1-phosphate phosphatase 1 [Biomphalaria glabrata]|uniref:Phosphatidic acid phosphatase type 2/haloperoxidase domain-containing protein n=1 Tax=Biomphalaria glabrata TaxID=6526 RepID=A0A2C9JJS0_BIOGL|nr:sphingosine-1-phosphate phosphatase 1-like [Biomphalaria glabrata]